MSRTDEAPKKRGISIVNWMGTLFLAAIPGVNIAVLILFAAFGKSSSKRTFAGAALILMAIFAVLAAAAFVIFGDQLTEFAHRLAAE
jgi:sterol desaturase/sphingolipid hydroxylase (fatty acid hydroxylase superfamily)